MARSSITAAIMVLLTSAIILGANAAREDMNIATIKDTNGVMFGPYIVKDLHPHTEDDIPVAAPFESHDGAADEGSGDYGGDDLLGYDDMEGGDDSDAGVIVKNSTPKTTSNKPGDEISGETINIKPVGGKSSNNAQGNEIIGDPNNKIIPEAIGELTNSELFDEVINNDSASTTMNPTTTTIISNTSPKQETTSSQPQTKPETNDPIRSTREGGAITEPNSSSVCSNTCVELIHSAKLHTMPATSMVRVDHSLILTCQIDLTKENSTFKFGDIQLRWIFEAEVLTNSMCSLDEQGNLQTCEGFSNVNDWQSRNSSHLTTVLTLTELQTHNTGKYMCQVIGHCCEDMIPQHELDHRVVVWQVYYTTELIVMSLTATIMLVVLICGLVYHRKKFSQLKYNYSQVILVPAKTASNTKTHASSSKVVHLALHQGEQDNESFSSFDDDDDDDDQPV